MSFAIVCKAKGIELVAKDREYSANCPFHDPKKEDKKRLYVNETKGFFKCYDEKCKKEGDLEMFVNLLGHDKAWLAQVLFDESRLQIAENLAYLFDWISSKNPEERAEIAKSLAAHL